jgi:glucose-6-phosphate isomerase
MSWPPSLLQLSAHLPWWLDATASGVSTDALDALPWQRVFTEMAALEAGELANVDEQRQVGHYWLRAPERAPTIGQAKAIGETTEAVRSFARHVREGVLQTPARTRFTQLLHIGIGGSALGPQLLAHALDPREGGLRPHFIDNTDPDGIARTLRGLGTDLAHTLVAVVSKSGGTVETRNALELTLEAMRQASLQPFGHLVGITGSGSKLHARAQAEGWLRTFPLWDWVGGRTSVTSAVGLLPAALLDLDVPGLLGGASEMDDWTRRAQWRDNPAALLAGVWYVLGEGAGNRNMVVLPYSDRLLLFGRYLQQLVMESLGQQLDRQGARVQQGLTVYGNKGSTDQHAYVQQLRDGRNDFFATFIQVLGSGQGSTMALEPDLTAGDYLQGFLLGTRRALEAQERPSLTLTVPTVNARVLGGLIALFERAVGLYASLIDVNAYHQPGVEAGKKAANNVVQLSIRLRELLQHARTVPTAAALLDADESEVFYVLEHLVHTGRVVREGTPPDARYRTARGAER